MTEKIQRNNRSKADLSLLVIALLASLVIWKRASVPDEWRIQIADQAVPAVPAVPEAAFSSELVSDAVDRFVHAASVAELEDGRLLSVWFSGSREGARDVQIMGAFYDPSTRSWGKDQLFVTRSGTREELGRYIRKLGNPIVTQAPDGKLWLFYVSVSVGGWAGSAINARYSENGGVSWSRTERLITTPFFNISTLIKGTPYFYRDGSIGLPAYHEFMGKFAELLRLDPNGKVLDKVRITHGKHSLQPVILGSNESQATALMRYAGAPPMRMLLSQSQDGGQHWSAAFHNDVANPNSALSAIRLPNGDMLGVMNDLEENRYRLSLLRSRDDGKHWEHLALLEGDPEHDGKRLPREAYSELLQEDFLGSSSRNEQPRWRRYSKHLDKRVCRRSGCRFIYDYPYMIQGRDGDIHIVYTWNKSFIKHLRFNASWIGTL